MPERYVAQTRGTGVQRPGRLAALGDARVEARPRGELARDARVAEQPAHLVDGRRIGQVGDGDAVDIEPRERALAAEHDRHLVLHAVGETEVDVLDPPDQLDVSALVERELVDRRERLEVGEHHRGGGAQPGADERAVNDTRQPAAKR